MFRRGPFLVPSLIINPRTSSHPVRIAIPALPFDPGQRLARGHGCLPGFIEVDADTPRPPDAPPFANEADVAEQARRRRHAIEPCHVARWIDAVEMDRVFDLHDMIVASEIDAVQRIL